MQGNLEHVDEEATVEQAKKHGYRVFKFAFLGVRAAPDRVYGRNGDAVFIEHKRNGKEPTLQQLKRHDEMRRDFGFRVEWTDSYAGACAILGIPE